MKPIMLAKRLAVLVILVSLSGGAMLAFTHRLLPALSAGTLTMGYISGELNNVAGIKTTLPFTITASGILPNGVSVSTTQVSTLQPTFVFTPLTVVDDLSVVMYDESGARAPVVPITWTVSAQAPGSCYSVTPADYKVFLSKMWPGFRDAVFAPTYESAPAFITVILTEVVGFGLHPPQTAVIEPPTQANADSQLSDIQYKLTRSDGVEFLSPVLPVNDLYTFSNLLTDEPPDGSCTWVYTATVAAIHPYMNAVPWLVAPYRGVPIRVGPGYSYSQAHFVTYYLNSYIPVFSGTPDP